MVPKICPDDSSYWFVMAAYRFEIKAERQLCEAGFEVFLPKETIFEKRPRRRPRPVERPAIPTFIFIKSSLAKLLQYKHTVEPRLKFYMTSPNFSPLPSKNPPSFTRDNAPAESSSPTRFCRRQSLSANAPATNYLIVPDSQMDAFRTAWKHRNTLKTSFSIATPEIPTSAGSEVEIIAGDLAGQHAFLLKPITARSRNARLSLSLSPILSITLTLPTDSIRLINANG